MPEGSPGECVCLQISVPVGCLLGVMHWGQGPWRLKGQGLSGLSRSARKWGATLETLRPKGLRAGQGLPRGVAGQGQPPGVTSDCLEPRVFLCCVAHAP